MNVQYEDIDEYCKGSVRNKNCYLCGNPVDQNVPTTKEVVLDRKPRKVHSNCLKDYRRAREELKRFQAEVG